MTETSADKTKIVRIVYTNYRGETNTREIIPKEMYFASTDWHPEKQWLLKAFDISKNADRSFAVKDIRCWF